jgi:bis(5'-nucleosyl)-tetraphosphatase (symmetrical)
LQQLLARIGFRREQDQLWFVGDLVNRGPRSLEVLRFVRSLEDRAITVLGNHDLHLIMQAEGFERSREDDTLAEVLGAPDGKALVDWLRARPMMHAHGRYAMVHAGLLPQWSVAKGLALAAEVEAALRGHSYRGFLQHLYGGTPDRWSDDLDGWDRLRVIVNGMTRMRFCTPDGRMDFKSKGTQPPRGYQPWFELRRAEGPTLICGHWSALGLKLIPGAAMLDSGCVWGGALSALRLEDGALYQLPCPGYQQAGEEA